MKLSKKKAFPFFVQYCNKSNVRNESQCTLLSFLPLPTSFSLLLFKPNTTKGIGLVRKVVSLLYSVCHFQGIQVASPFTVDCILFFLTIVLISCQINKRQIRLIPSFLLKLLSQDCQFGLEGSMKLEFDINSLQH